MYLVNQRIILLVKMTVVLGIPLLCSFFLPWLAMWQLPSVALVFVAYYLNNLYPDRILLEQERVAIKIFLYNDWLVYRLEQVQYAQGKQCIYLYIDGVCRYRLSMEKLSVRLYLQLTELLEPYPATKKDVL